jgi:hypothetical protein
MLPFCPDIVENILSSSGKKGEIWSLSAKYSLFMEIIGQN